MARHQKGTRQGSRRTISVGGYPGLTREGTTTGTCRYNARIESVDETGWP
jgi:hypothetical protein